MKRYEIDEKTARSAKELNSFDDYKENSATNEYNSYLNDFEKEVDELIKLHPENVNDETLELIEYYKNKYSQKLAYAINKYNSIEARMPSMMISGCGNFNVRKKQKQNQSRDSFWKNEGKIFEDNNYYFNKIRNILTNKTIYSDDALAIEKLENKIADLKESQQLMKEVNAYYRKNKTIDNCELLTDKQIIEIKRNMEVVTWYDAPFPPFSLQNNLANIKRLEERLESLKKMKERAETPDENKYPKVEGLQVVEDATDMRIRIIFEDIPNADTRYLLKSNGFKWSPSNSAWQRQLTSNGIYATKQVLNKILEVK